MGSLRDMGYSAEAAVADLVDNAIDAGATTIRLDLVFDGSSSWMRIVDDGHGMASGDIEEAMRYGSRRDYRSGDLGRFGLGLKTASLSQCRRLTVASRIAPVNARLHGARWDLDLVAETDEWSLQRLATRDLDERTLDPLRAGTGTVVLWESLDRLLTYRDPESGHAERGLAVLSDTIRDHLSMVFHRFLSGESRAGGYLRLEVNGIPVEPWDPFCRLEPATHRLAPQRLRPDELETSAVLTVRPYILPAQARFSTPEAHALAGGPRRWNRQQGLYIYIRDRLVQSGGWSRLRAEDEHTKLARVAVDVPEELEGLFAINVSKMRVAVPPTLRKPLQAVVSGVTTRAREAYHSHAVGPAPDMVDSLADADYVVVSDDVLSIERVATVLVVALEDQPDLLRSILGQLGLAILDERPVGAVDVYVGRH